ncbi:MAG: ferrochelatase [Syntrophorhabdales bacterium]|jgi:ferrochelatase
MVLLVNFGGPRTLDDVPLFLANIVGRTVPDDVRQAVEERYRAIGGGSPLPAITEDQAALLADATGHRFPVGCAFRYSRPTLEEMINECYRSQMERIVFFVMSPYYTSRTVDSYVKTVETYLSFLSSIAYRPEVTFIHSWCREPLFIETWARRIREETREGDQREAFYLFSAHSLPQSLKDEPYVPEVQETVAAVAARLTLSDNYAIGWQSVPPQPEEPWIGPTVEEVIDGRAAEGRTLIEVPIGFVSDHLETLYDIDIVHREYARTKGVPFSRIPSLNTYPPFIDALKAILEMHLQGGQ